MMKFKLNPPSAIQLFSLTLIAAAWVCSLTIVNVVKKRYFFDFSEWLMMGSVLIFGRSVSRWAIRVMVYSIFGGSGNNLFMRKRVLYFVYRMRNSLQNCVWLAMVLVVWECNFDEKKKIMPHVTKIWLCLLVGTSIWLLKVMLVKVWTLSFYVSGFLDRIQQSLLDQYVIETLSGSPLDALGQLLEGEPNDITIDHICRLNHRNISAWIMKRLITFVRNGLFSTPDEKLHEDDAMVKITSENQAKATAEKILKNAAKPQCGYLYHEDLIRFFEEDEALMTMRLLEDGSKREKIRLEEDINEPSIFVADFKSWVVNAFRERRALVLSINDTKTAIYKVDRVLNVLVGVVVLLVCLSIFDVAMRYFVLLNLLFVSLIFVFRNTFKVMFRAFIFFFATHPFDVGDLVQVDGDRMVVERMHILTTVFVKCDNGEKIYFPNIDLVKKPINNYRRKKNVVRM
ncbi:hypothetical protein ACP275_03G082900 [Erythranthe tilingii]